MDYEIVDKVITAVIAVVSYVLGRIFKVPKDKKY